MSRCEWINGQALKVLPTRLVKLNLSNCQRIIYDLDIANLHHNLKHLILTDCPRLTLEGLKDLPPRLQVLELGGTTEFPDRSEALYILPRTLKHLRLPKGFPYTLSNWSAKKLESLPPNLESLRIRMKFTAELVAALPRTITSLTLILPWDVTQMAAEDWSALPPNLSSLRLICKVRPPVQGDTLKFIPPQISTLRIHGPYFDAWELQHLPFNCGLRVLELVGMRNLYGEFSHLPSGLHTLILTRVQSIYGGKLSLPPTVKTLQLSSDLLQRTRVPPGDQVKIIKTMD